MWGSAVGKKRDFWRNNVNVGNGNLRGKCIAGSIICCYGIAAGKRQLDTFRVHGKHDTVIVFRCFFIPQNQLTCGIEHLGIDDLIDIVLIRHRYKCGDRLIGFLVIGEIPLNGTAVSCVPLFVTPRTLQQSWKSTTAWTAR